FIQKLSENFDIKIGDKNKTVFGPQHYEIKYRVYNAFLFENELIRFYWNIKPGLWQAVFKKVDFTIHPPQITDLNADDIFVYSGWVSEAKESEEFKVRFKNGVYKAESNANFISVPGQSVTVLL